MPSFWKRMRDRFSPPQKEVGAQNWEPDRAHREPAGSDRALNTNASASRAGYPNTFQGDTSRSQKTDGARIFDPALQHYAHAFRLGDPAFADPEARERWQDARKQVIDHLLRIVVGSPWNDHLVLRGSLLLKAWLGKEAREPGDIDWVVRPASKSLTDPWSKGLFEGMVRMVSEQPIVENAVIEVDRIAVDDIWTYDRAPGRRIVFPWRSEDLPPGAVQMDMVFQEELWSDPVQVAIPSARGDATLVWAASKEMSLAWKLIWLETDAYPQGKDLYDATLLAEQTLLPLDLLTQILHQSNEWGSPREITPDFPLKWYVDWENFKLEYPWVEGQAEDWQDRLTTALAPTFASANSSHADPGQ